MIESHQTQMVILVDRDPLLRTRLSAAINERQWSTSEFESVETCTNAIEMLSSDLTLCVVSEFGLPGRGGLTLIGLRSGFSSGLLFNGTRATSK